MKHKGNLSISRVTGTCGEHIAIKVNDKAAGVQFLEIEVALKEFAQAVTGLGFIDCELYTRNLENVGKKIERAPLRFKMPEDAPWRCDETALKEAQRLTPKGWQCEIKFNSQDSFYLVDGHQWAQTTIRRWVDNG